MAQFWGYWAICTQENWIVFFHFFLYSAQQIQYIIPFFFLPMWPCIKTRRDIAMRTFSYDTMNSMISVGLGWFSIFLFLQLPSLHAWSWEDTLYISFFFFSLESLSLSFFLVPKTYHPVSLGDHTDMRIGKYAPAAMTCECAQSLRSDPSAF